MAIKIMLDAGHYGKYNRSPCIKTYYESEMNWKLHNWLKYYLERFGFTVLQTRADQKKDMAVVQRGRSAKGCDLLFSIHSNAVGSTANENIDYPVAYVPLDGKGTALGKLLAQCVEKMMGTKQKAQVQTRQGNNGDYYGIIRGATSVGVPCIILEHSFHTNTKATEWLLNDDNLEAIAEAEAEIIAEYYGLYKATEPTQTKEVKYSVQVGAFSSKSLADAMVTNLKRAGFADAFVVEKGEPVKEEPKAEPKTIKVGSVVKIKSGAYMYGTTRKLSSWVYPLEWVVLQIKGERVVVDKSADGKHSIETPVNIKDLTLIK